METTAMDDFTKRHFEIWLEGHVCADEHEEVRKIIEQAYADYPLTAQNRSYGELLALADYTPTWNRG